VKDDESLVAQHIAGQNLAEMRVVEAFLNLSQRFAENIFVER